MSIHTDLYYWNSFRKLKNKFIQNIKTDPVIKTTEDSKNIYDGYDDREQRSFEYGSNRCLLHNHLITMTKREIRYMYLRHIYSVIDEMIKKDEISTVLEVGCGNCINLMMLKEHYGDSLKLFGMDISQKRLDVAKNYFGEKLAGIELFQQSIVENTGIASSYYDLVFTMHCLEQIPYKIERALSEIYRITNNNLVLIEPVFEFCNPAQKMYLYYSDHNRILLKTIEKLDLPVIYKRSLEIQSNPLNQSSIIVIERRSLNV